MSWRTVLFCLIAIAAAGLFTRLGFWQLERLHERQARNILIARQLRSAPIPLVRLPRDTGAARHRPATVTGTYDYAHELVATARTRRGSPGVDLLTPVRIAGSDTAVLVNRGWVYSPDGRSVELARWREGESAHASGYVELYSAAAPGTTSADPRLIRRASVSEITARLPYPVMPYYLVAVGDGVDSTRPSRRELPVLTEGSHRLYALQWFAFAAIALAGAAIVVRRERETPREPVLE